MPQSDVTERNCRKQFPVVILTQSAIAIPQLYIAFCMIGVHAERTREQVVWQFAYKTLV